MLGRFMSTSVNAEFAGKKRRFQLVATMPSRMYGGFEIDGGNLVELAQRVRNGTLGLRQVRHILVHGLVGGELAAGQRAYPSDFEALVDDEMRDKPLTSFTPLAVDIITAAYAGAEA